MSRAASLTTVYENVVCKTHHRSSCDCEQSKAMKAQISDATLEQIFSVINARCKLETGMVLNAPLLQFCYHLLQRGKGKMEGVGV